MSKPERTLQMLAVLMNSKKYSINEMAEKLGVSRRTVYRYIDTLGKSGLDVYNENHTVQIESQANFVNDLGQLFVLNNAEATSLYNALDITEIDRQVKERLKQKMRALFGNLDSGNMSARIDHSNNLKRLNQAISEQKQVILQNYSSPNSESSRDRLVEAFRISEDMQYVWCYECESDKNKIFKISRIGSIDIQDQKWKYVHMHRAGYTDAFRIISFDGSVRHARLEMNRRAVELLKEEFPQTEKYIQRKDENEEKWIADIPVSNWVGIGRFVMGLPDCIEILTDDLRDYVREQYSRWMTIDNG